MKKQARFQPKSPRKKSTFVASDLPVVNLDARLKDIVRAHPEAFMRFFFSDLSREIDFVRGVEFLDKESQHLLPGYGKKGQRTGDLLMQWFLLTGERQFVLAHTEF